MMAASTINAMADPIRIFAVSDNDERPPAVALKRKDWTNTVNRKRNIYGADGTVASDSKSIFMLGSVPGSVPCVLFCEPPRLRFRFALTSLSWPYNINHWEIAISTIGVRLKCTTRITAVTTEKVWFGLDKGNKSILRM
jgi:hypothetical protein